MPRMSDCIGKDFAMSDDLVSRLIDEADLCRSEGATDIATLLDTAAKEIKLLRAEYNVAVEYDLLANDILSRTLVGPEASPEYDQIMPHPVWANKAAAAITRLRGENATLTSAARRGQRRGRRAPKKYERYVCPGCGLSVADNWAIRHQACRHKQGGRPVEKVEG